MKNKYIIYLCNKANIAGWSAENDGGEVLASGSSEYWVGLTECLLMAAIEAYTILPEGEKQIVFASPNIRTLKRRKGEQNKRGSIVELWHKFDALMSEVDVAYEKISKDCVQLKVAKQEIARRLEKKHEAQETTSEEDYLAGYIAYTDGSCNNFSPYGEGGAAYVLLDSQMNVVKQNSRGFLGTTNNRMELLAILSAIAAVPAGSAVEVRTDSQYCITVLENSANADKPFKVNGDIITKYSRYAGRLKQVRFVWLKGHDGEEWNELCDALAQSRTEEMRTLHNIPVYGAHNSPKCKKRGATKIERPSTKRWRRPRKWV